jgi:peptidoglycan/LPS O-acetylase OafA/YrhL
MQHGGRISYALYLVHFPMLEVTLVAMTRFGVLAPNSSGAALLVPHVLAASFLVAHLAYRFVEVPAQQWLRAKDPLRRRGSARRDVGEERRVSGIACHRTQFHSRVVRQGAGGRSAAGCGAART